MNLANLFFSGRLRLPASVVAPWPEHGNPLFSAFTGLRFPDSKDLNINANFFPLSLPDPWDDKTSFSWANFASRSSTRQWAIQVLWDPRARLELRKLSYSDDDLIRIGTLALSPLLLSLNRFIWGGMVSSLWSFPAFPGRESGKAARTGDRTDGCLSNMIIRGLTSASGAWWQREKGCPSSHRLCISFRKYPPRLWIWVLAQ